jgi:hypothetical protein
MRLGQRFESARRFVPRILLAGDAEAREEEYMAEGSFMRPFTVINVPKLHTI